MRNFFRAVVLVVVCNFASVDSVRSQDFTKKFGEDSIACRSNISLYREYYRQKNYIEAYPYWQLVVADCPMSTEYIFAEGPVILEGILNEDKDTVKFLKELFDLFELRIKCYPQKEGYTLGRMGIYTTKFRGKTEYKKAYEYLEKSIDLSGVESSPQVLDIYFMMAEVYMVADKLPADIIMDAYDKVSEVLEKMQDIAEMNLDSIMHMVYELNEKLEEETIDNEKYLADYEKLRKDSALFANELTQLTNVGNNMDIRFSKHANCEMLLQVYAKKLETNKDERTLRQIMRFLEKVKSTNNENANCTDNEVYSTAAEELHKIEPTFKTAYHMGKVYHEKKQYNDALNYYKDASELSKKEADIIKAYIMMADCYVKLNQYSATREIANKILKLNPNKGIAYILIGNAYMSAVSSCNTDIPGAVYWAAADKFLKAKNIDPSVEKEATQLLNFAAARFPTIDEVFGRGYVKGQSYKIECWINETTTIR